MPSLLSTSGPLLRPLLRFWWLPVLGLAIAVVAGVQVLDQLRPGWPPRLTERTPARYAATALVMIDRPDHPYLATRTIRTSAQGVELHLTCPQSAEGNRKCHYVQVPTPVSSHSVEPDIETPVTDANIYPMLVESDQLRAFRDRRYPGLPNGSISSNAYGARDLTPTAANAAPVRGGFTPSRYPLVEITANALSRPAAGRLAAATAHALAQYVTAQQAAQSIPPGERVRIEVLKAPELGIAVTSSDVPKALLAALATLL